MQGVRTTVAEAISLRAREGSAVRPRRRVLLFAEGATLAHVARPLAICQLLAGEDCDFVLACPPAFRWAVDESCCEWRELECQSAAEFSRRLARGAPLYDFQTLLGYVEADEALMADVRPDVVIGDFRLSLAVSARRARVPYIAIGDAYWCEDELWPPPLPVLAGLSWIPLPLREAGFRLAAPLAFRVHARAMDRLRRHFGLRGVNGRLSSAYQDADRILFANYPALFPATAGKRPQDFIGPLLWQMPVEPPEWIDDLPDPSECVFVTMGSSGAAHLVQNVVDAVRAAGKTAIVATAGRVELETQPAHGVFAAEFLPGRWACQAASLAVSNGGSPISQLALSEGRPVLGICLNMDQFLNMRALCAEGCGAWMRAESCATRAIQHRISAICDSELLRAGARRIRDSADPQAALRLTDAIRQTTTS